MAEDTHHFYERLPELPRFADIAGSGAARPAPDDWVVIITDVVGSTDAIEAGRHKDVNLAGVATIIALRNRCGRLAFPYVFGGDGATFLLPESHLAGARDVLADARRTCREAFALDLRVGFVPVRELRAAGHEVLVARHRVSKIYVQAVLAGSGVDEAERLVKDPVLGQRYALPTDHEPVAPASFAGVFCPFQDIRGGKEETVSLIVKLTASSPERQTADLRELLATLDALLGGSEAYHPLGAGLRVEWARPERTRTLVALSAGSASGWRAAAFRGIHAAIHAVTKLTFRKVLPRDADFRKYDGSLKMVVGCSTRAREALVEHLERERAGGRLCYGLHVSDKALVTCCMHFGTLDGPLHFVDGANGGYALAAKQLKRQLQEARRDDAR